MTTTDKRIPERLTPVRKSLVVQYWDKGKGGLSPEDLKSLDTEKLESGGYGLRSQDDLEEVIPLQPTQRPPILDLVTVKDLTKSDSYPAGRFTSPFKVVRRGEMDQHAVTDSANLGFERIPTHYLVATPEVSNRFIESMPDTVETWLFPEILSSFYWQEGKEILVGQGSPGLECEGALFAPGVPVINSGDANLIKESGLREMFYGLPERFRRQAVWVMHSTTASAIRGLKDQQNQPIFIDGEFGISPDALFGRPVLTDDNMPVIAANAFPVILGAWSYYYLVVRQAFGALIDPFSRKGFTVFDCTRRSGGQVMRPDAFRKLKIST